MTGGATQSTEEVCEHTHYFTPAHHYVDVTCFPGEKNQVFNLSVQKLDVV